MIPSMKKEPNFKVVSPYQPAGDQPTAIKALSESILKGNRYQLKILSYWIDLRFPNLPLKY